MIFIVILMGITTLLGVLIVIGFASAIGQILWAMYTMPKEEKNELLKGRRSGWTNYHTKSSELID